MLKNILNLENAEKVSKNEQKKLNGGWSSWPRTERECLTCGGEWSPIPFPPGGICALPSNSPCA
ncbi:MAG: hypothetical protein WBA74_16315 [Cyclobacteriaceae bacterium]